MINPLRKPLVLVLDAQSGGFSEFYSTLGRHASIHSFTGIKPLLASDQILDPDSLLLLDLADVEARPEAELETLLEFTGRGRVAFLAANETGDYIPAIDRWGIMRVLVKEPPVDGDEIELFLRCLQDPENGFGLGAYLTRTIEMYRFSVANREEKLGVAERVINHFATAGYQVHDLYDVRLVLEEALNNAIYHAFRTGTGEEKYHPDDFSDLDRREKVLIEFGSNGRMAGFTVTDNAGTLHVDTILEKLRKQQDPAGIYQLGGRGLHLSRMLSSLFVINLDPGNRSQIIALFDERRRMERVKPFLINIVDAKDATHRPGKSL